MGSHHLLPPQAHLSHHWLLVTHPYNEDAVSLTYAPHGPGGQGGVGQVEDNAVAVLLLCQPPREAVLLDAAEMEGSAGGTVMVGRC